MERRESQRSVAHARRSLSSLASLRRLRRYCRSCSPALGCLDVQRCDEGTLQRRHVLVAAAGKPDENARPRMRRCPSLGAHERVRALDGGKNAFEAAALLYCRERVVIGCHLVADTAGGGIERMLRTDAGIIEAGRDGVSL